MYGELLPEIDACLLGLIDLCTFFALFCFLFLPLITVKMVQVMHFTEVARV